MKYLNSLIALPFITALALASPNQTTTGSNLKAEKPLIVGIPPADAGRGLVRISKKEIRHYSGDRNRQFYLVSRDNGKTWKEEDAVKSYPPNLAGHSKEAPSISAFPGGKEFIRVQKINGFVFLSKGGIDGKWGAVNKEGKLDFDWAKRSPEYRKEHYVNLGGLLRTPYFVNKGKRILVPGHGGSTHFHISDDGGLTWTRSKNSIGSPRHTVNEIDKGVRWQNGGVESTIIELKNKKLWALIRTSQNNHYEAFSKDWGTTWTKAQPSRFAGTLTMPLFHRLRDGRIICSWTNSKALPEAYRSNPQWMAEKGYKRHGGEDAFTNRDSHHLAISEDDGETWFGFREIALDHDRNLGNYATNHGSEDRGKHQSEIVQVAKNKILIALGQHKMHRKLMLVDLNYLYETKRQSDFENGLDDWVVHSYIPYTKGHCAYNRKEGSKIVKKAGDKVLQIHRVSDEELTNPKYEINYEKGGATWNFPNGKKGMLRLNFSLDEDSQGTQISLTDRLFNACDETTAQLAVYSLKLKVGAKLGSTRLKANKDYQLTFKWNGVDKDKRCIVYLDKKKVAILNCIKESPNGLSYIHFISTAETADQGMYLKSVKASVK